MADMAAAETSAGTEEKAAVTVVGTEVAVEKPMETENAAKPAGSQEATAATAGDEPMDSSQGKKKEAERRKIMLYFWTFLDLWDIFFVSPDRHKLFNLLTPKIPVSLSYL